MTATAFAQSPSSQGDVVDEVAHAAPIVALIDATSTLVHGTTERGATMTAVETSSDINAFRFPATLGHLRGYATNRIPESARYGEHPALFDAATMIPPVSYTGCGRFDSTCRSVFTTVTPGAHPARVMLEEKTLSTVGPLLASGTALSPASSRHFSGSLVRCSSSKSVSPSRLIETLLPSTRTVSPGRPMTRLMKSSDSSTG